MYTNRIRMAGISSAFLFSSALLLTACPIAFEYQRGYGDGFAQDDWYWAGFDDSYDTLTASPLYYQGDTIPFVETPDYDRGYYDGIWYAYHDGYFVSYDDAFTIGFSEGYDAAFYSDYLTFLANDPHVEYDNGGWGDGYNDGFSEGRIFGAYDYEQGWSLNWLDALLDYRSGTDLYFSEIDLGTGAYGPVVLYVYGTDPTAAKQLVAIRSQHPRKAVRQVIAANAVKAADTLYRPLTDDARAKLDKRPSTTARSSRPLTLTTTWLERVQAYQQAQANPAKSARLRTLEK